MARVHDGPTVRSRRSITEQDIGCQVGGLRHHPRLSAVGGPDNCGSGRHCAVRCLEPGGLGGLRAETIGQQAAPGTGVIACKVERLAQRVGELPATGITIPRRLG